MLMKCTNCNVKEGTSLNPLFGRCIGPGRGVLLNVKELVTANGRCPGGWSQMVNRKRCMPEMK
ncbi:hypothetical protein AMTR_s00012p00095790 [Amborella trichopoda]|uniref:Uncharacterized protein n=1 Tax=Amborella trichopoda TaxID=13333 RepID=W1PJD2_AMBTC|nr:hypothetical protein AMTR_s00012p00095790 [Amborella trichopoda]